MSTFHPQVAIGRKDGSEVLVDAGLADLIRALWQAGMDTCSPSCEDWSALDPGFDSGTAGVAFPTVHLARRFVHLVRPLSPMTLVPVPPPTGERGAVVMFPTSRIPTVTRAVRIASTVRPRR